MTVSGQCCQVRKMWVNIVNTPPYIALHKLYRADAFKIDQPKLLGMAKAPRPKW